MLYPKILLVDGDPEVRRVIKTGLETSFLGATIFSVGDGEKALEEFLEARDDPEVGGFDIVITALKPGRRAGINGRGVARGVKSMDPCCPVVLLTGAADGEGVGDDIDEVILKPFDPNDLGRIVKSLLDT